MGRDEAGAIQHPPLDAADCGRAGLGFLGLSTSILR